MPKQKTPNVPNLVLEHLRAMRTQQDHMAADLRDIKTRLTSVEISIATLLGADAGKSERIDRLEDRIERVERRLEIYGGKQ